MTRTCRANYGVLWLALCGSSCLVDTEASDDEHGPPRDHARATSSSLVRPPDDPDLCELLPTSGPCALACDPVALGEGYLPEGTCGTFLCVLTNGRELSVHACHRPD